MSDLSIRQAMGQEIDSDEDQDDEDEVVIKFEWQEYLPKEAKIQESFTLVGAFFKRNSKFRILIIIYWSGLNLTENISVDGWLHKNELPGNAQREVS